MANQMLTDKDSVIRFDGLPWLEVPITAALIPGEATATAKADRIEVVRQTQTAVATSFVDENGEPIMLEATITVRRSPRNEVERKACEAKRAQSAKSRDTKVQAEQASRDREMRSIRGAVLETVTALQAQDTARTLGQQIIAGVVGNLGKLGLPSGETK